MQHQMMNGSQTLFGCIQAAVLITAVAALAACGGGGGSPSSPPPPPAPAALTGKVDGLVQSGLILKNGSESLTVAANATSFAFTTLLAYNTAYAVTVQQQPTGQTCAVNNGSGMSGVTTTPITLSCAGLLWTWLGGSSMPNGGSSYGSKGVTAASNMPGARAAAASWSDASGALWMFGGYGNSSAATGYLNDLWKFEPQKGLWTWMSGPSTANAVGVYGVQGMADPANSPGARNYSASWIDITGAVWIFGGYGYGSGTANSVYLNDLWKFEPASGNWTWVSGSNVGGANGNYGTLGVAAPGNTPGAREGAAHWVDTAGALWLFGGYGTDSVGAINELNDLWKYSAGQWTWMGGAATAAAAGVYGTMGVAAPANQPGARRWSVAWIDGVGKLWLFGGEGYDSVGTPFGALNDLWSYDPMLNLWTWRNGANTVDGFGVYGTPGTGNAANVPGARDQAVGWRDGAGILWLYGGNGFGATGTRSSLNDLWKYDASGQWTWVSGSMATDAAGSYGTRGVAMASNVPGARQLAATWLDGNDTLWLFGGFGNDSTGTSLHYLNDLWFVLPR